MVREGLTEYVGFEDGLFSWLVSSSNGWLYGEVLGGELTPWRSDISTWSFSVLVEDCGICLSVYSGIQSCYWRGA